MTNDEAMQYKFNHSDESIIGACGLDKMMVDNINALVYFVLTTEFLSHERDGVTPSQAYEKLLKMFIGNQVLGETFVRWLMTCGFLYLMDMYEKFTKIKLANDDYYMGTDIQ